MTETPFSDLGAADPTTEPFWAGCAGRRLLLQRCSGCGRFQHYPRPFCLGCGGDALAWTQAGGGGRVYSVATMRLPVIDELPPPYQIALVDLDEGVRMLAGIEGREARIGDRVRLAWRPRGGGLPPLPVFAVEG